MSDETSPGPAGAPADAGDSRTRPGTGPLAQVIGNASFLTALLVYMGWAYENALLGYFYVSPFSLNIGVLEYGLKSLAFFFQTNFIFAAAVLLAVITVGYRAGFLKRLFPRAVRGVLSSVPAYNLMEAAGLLIVAVSVPLAWVGVSDNTFASWFFYCIVALLGVGPLLLTWPARFRGPRSFAYPLALAVAAACAVWIGGLYAQNLGTSAARRIAERLSAQTAVVLYSVQSPALSGPGVSCKPLPSGSLYRYRCAGLRLLYAEPGTYYLLPVGWTRQQGQTYIFRDTSRIRIELTHGR